VKLWFLPLLQSSLLLPSPRTNSLRYPQRFSQCVSFFLLSVQFSSVAQSCPTLYDPMNCSTPGLPVHHQLPEFTQTHVHRVRDAIQSSHPLSPHSPPAPNPCQHQGLFQWVHWTTRGVPRLAFVILNSHCSYQILVSLLAYVFLHLLHAISRDFECFYFFQWFSPVCGAYVYRAPHVVIATVELKRVHNLSTNINILKIRPVVIGQALSKNSEEGG